MASIKKLPNGRFQATVFVGRLATGKQDKRKKTFDSEKEAKTWARDLEKDIEDRKFTNMDNMRASLWFDEWLNINRNRLSPSTFVSYKLYVEKHFKPTFGAFKLGQIRELHIKKYVNDKLGNKLSPTTVRKHLLVLREILHDALKLKSPCRDIEILKPEKYIPHVISEEEFEQIHAAVKGTRDELIVLLSAWGGLRLGEIFGLKWNDINWKDETIRIDENKAVSENGYVDKKPKSDNSLRNVVVPQELISILKNYRMSIIETKDKSKKSARYSFNRAIKALLIKHKSDSIASVPEDKKQEFMAELNTIQQRLFPMRPDSYSTYFGKLINKKKLPPIRFHDLRHYHATWLYNQGISDQYAAQRLGHDIKTLKGIYQHLEAGVQTKTDEIIRSRLGSRKTSEN